MAEVLQTQSPSSPLKPFVPIYEQLVEQYKGAILEQHLRAGDRVDSISQIQRRYGVARETAKRVLGILAQEGYIVQRPGKGSFVAERREKQPVWGVVIPFYSVQYEDLLSRVTQLAAPLGRTVQRLYDYNNWEEEIRLVKMMLEARYEAIIVIPTLDESLTWSFYSQLAVADSPVVLFDHTMTYRDFNFVVQSYDLGVVRAMEYLLDRGAGGIAFVKNEGWMGRNMVLDLMVETYRMVLRRRRPECEEVILERAGLVDGVSLRDQDVTGVFCCDDVSAIQVIGRLREQGVAIPGDLHLVSHGNTDLARFFRPALTSVDPHNDEMAQRLVEVLASIEGAAQGQPQQYVIQPELIVRET